MLTKQNILLVILEIRISSPPNTHLLISCGAHRGTVMRFSQISRSRSLLLQYEDFPAVVKLNV
jgi:ribosomal protein RSM22 (predicted rRNA methylase)